MKKFKKEIIAIVSGIAFAYVFQLFFLFLCYITGSFGSLITQDTFIPIWQFQLIIAPPVAWILMGLFKVAWIKRWVRITISGLAFIMPFTLIAIIVAIIAPNLWQYKMYWAACVGLSAIFAFCFFQFKFLDME